MSPRIVLVLQNCCFSKSSYKKVYSPNRQLQWLCSLLNMNPHARMRFSLIYKAQKSRNVTQARHNMLKDVHGWHPYHFELIDMFSHNCKLLCHAKGVGQYIREIGAVVSVLATRLWYYLKEGIYDLARSISVLSAIKYWVWAQSASSLASNLQQSREFFHSNGPWWARFLHLLITACSSKEANIHSSSGGAPRNLI